MQVKVYGTFVRRQGVDLTLMQDSDRGTRMINLFCPEDRVMPGFALGDAVVVDAVIGQKEGKRYYALVLSVSDAM